MFDPSPAPWSITGQSDGGKYITIKDARGRVVARVPFSPPNAARGEIHDAANADLIATAPKLLAAVDRAAASMRQVAFLLDKHLPGWRKEWTFHELRIDLLELAAEARGHGRSCSVTDSRAR